MKKHVVLLACVLSAVIFGMQAVSAARKPSGDDLLQIVRSGLGDDNSDVRILALESVGILKDTGALDSVKYLLTDDINAVRIKAAIVLHQMGDPSGLPELRKILSTRPKLSAKPTPLERARTVARGTIRAEAASALGDLRDGGSAALLRDMAEDEDGRVADASMASLARLGDRSVQAKFVSALESVKPEVRAKAATVLGDIGDAQCLPALRRRLKDWNRDAKIAAVFAAARLKDRESVPAIREMLSDVDPIIREKAASALGLIGDPATRDVLKKLLEDPNGLVRISAAEALFRLGNHGGKEFVVKALQAEDRDAKLRALAVLELMAVAKDAAVLQNMTIDADKAIAVMAARIILQVKTAGRQ